MTTDENGKGSAARYHVLEAVERGQREQGGRPLGALEIIDRLNANVPPEERERAAVNWHTILMELASSKYGYLESSLPSAFRLTRKGWEEGMSRRPEEFPWGG